MAGFDSEFVVAAAKVLDESVTCDDHGRGAVGLQAAHWPQPCFQSAVIALDSVVRVLHGGVQRLRHELVDHVRQRRRSVGDDLFRFAVRCDRGVKNRRAAGMSRRDETYTSMTWSCPSTARYT